MQLSFAQRKYAKLGAIFVILTAMFPPVVYWGGYHGYCVLLHPGREIRSFDLPRLFIEWVFIVALSFGLMVGHND